MSRRSSADELPVPELARADWALAVLSREDAIYIEALSKLPPDALDRIGELVGFGPGPRRADHVRAVILDTRAMNDRAISGFWEWLIDATERAMSPIRSGEKQYERVLTILHKSNADADLVKWVTDKRDEENTSRTKPVRRKRKDRAKLDAALFEQAAIEWILRSMGLGDARERAIDIAAFRNLVDRNVIFDRVNRSRGYIAAVKVRTAIVNRRPQP